MSTKKTTPTSIEQGLIGETAPLCKKICPSCGAELFVLDKLKKRLKSCPICHAHMTAEGQPMANTLKAQRRRAGLTQAELAAKADISLRTLQDYEQGRKPLSGAAAATVLKLTRALGLGLISDLEQLIGD